MCEENKTGGLRLEKMWERERKKYNFQQLQVSILKAFRKRGLCHNGSGYQPIREEGRGLLERREKKG
jgi:hypothetical protein